MANEFKDLTAQERAPSAGHQSFWVRMRAERRRQDLGDVVRQAIEITDDLQCLRDRLDEGKAKRKEIVRGVSDASDAMISLSLALRDVFDRDGGPAWESQG